MASVPGGAFARKTTAHLLLPFLLASLVVALSAAPARADIIDLPAPSDGCLDSVAGAVGLQEGVVTPAGGITLDVAGPVVQVLVEWVGEFDDEPADTAIGLEVTGPGGTEAGSPAGTQSGTDGAGGGVEVYAYYADVTDLFGTGAAGTYDVDVTAPPESLPGRNHWWGATVTVVYDTSPCDQVSELIWKIGADYYFGGNPGSVTTDLIVYEFDEPLAEDLTATLGTAHGGADATASLCRVSVLWVGTGSGAIPADLVDQDGNAVHPGAVEGVVDPFTPPNQPCPAETVNPPVTRVSGGSVGPEFALISFDVVIPAGSTWVAFQLESPQDNNGQSGIVPESGSWAGGGLLVLKTGAPEPGISLDKTVLDGAGAACPGEEGTDELVSTLTGSPVTYCFRVVNTGDTDLFPVTIDDPDLGIDQDDMVLVSGDDSVALPVGGELVYAVEAAADADLVNVATATGTPVDDTGAPIDGLDDVTDTNDAEVRVLVPDVALSKTVLDGAGAACPGTEGDDELVTGPAGTVVTYCFRVQNTGETALFPVLLDDPDLGIDQDDMVLVSGDDSVPLPVGGELVYAAEAEVDADLVNTAIVTGTPVDDDGQAYDVGEDVTDTNQAEVRVVVVPEVPVPDVLVEKTVLVGDGADCPGVEGTDERVTGVAATPVTWCVRVVNTGGVALFPVAVDDPELGIDQDDMTLLVGDDTIPLEPGGELVYAIDDTIDVDLRNTVEVTGTPVDGQAPVTDDNDASVVVRVGRVLAAEVVPPAPPPPLVAPGTALPMLPRTGMEVPTLVLLALGLLLAGGAVEVAHRRRTRAD